MAEWNQPKCERCWIEHEGRWDTDEAEGITYLSSVRIPFRLTDPDGPRVEQCAWCGQPTIVGIYVRADPATVPYPAVESDA